MDIGGHHLCDVMPFRMNRVASRTNVSSDAALFVAACVIVWWFISNVVGARIFQKTNCARAFLGVAQICSQISALLHFARGRTLEFAQRRPPLSPSMYTAWAIRNRCTLRALQEHTQVYVFKSTPSISHCVCVCVDIFKHSLYTNAQTQTTQHFLIYSLIGCLERAADNDAVLIQTRDDPLSACRQCVSQVPYIYINIFTFARGYTKHMCMYIRNLFSEYICILVYRYTFWAIDRN